MPFSCAFFLPASVPPSVDRQHCRLRVAKTYSFSFFCHRWMSFWRKIFTYFSGDERDAHNMAVTIYNLVRLCFPFFFSEFAWHCAQLLEAFSHTTKNGQNIGCLLLRPESIFNIILIDKVHFSNRAHADPLSAPAISQLTWERCV